MHKINHINRKQSKELVNCRFRRRCTLYCMLVYESWQGGCTQTHRLLVAADIIIRLLIFCEHGRESSSQGCSQF